MDVTVNRLFAQARLRFPQDEALRERKEGEWQVFSYELLGQAVQELGTGLISIGLQPGEKVGLFLKKSADWLIGDLAILGAGGIDVPRGIDTAPDELAYIVRHAGIRILFAELGSDTIHGLKRAVPNLKFVIPPDSVIHTAPDLDIVTWDDLMRIGREALSRGDESFLKRAEAVSEDDLATIVYTSGTTGRPKGVMLTHRNIAKDVSHVLECIPVQREERFLSILPPYHMFERIIEYVSLSSGACLVLSDLHSFSKDLIAQQPHYVAGVPRLWEKVYHSIFEKLKKEKHRFLIEFLMNISRRRNSSDGKIGHGGGYPTTLERIAGKLKRLLLLPFEKLAEHLIYEKIRGRLGGELKLAISGGGTLPLEIDKFFNSVGINLINGYGLTETSPVLTIRRPADNATGTVGRPLPQTEIKVCNEKGENVGVGRSGIIWAKGPQVMKGYYKDEEATNAVLNDGWLNTGDLGVLTPQGNLIIEGRAKDTIVLSSGENVEPAPVETRLVLSPFISQAMVVGQDQKHLGALIVPNWKGIENYIQKQGLVRSLPPGRHESQGGRRQGFLNAAVGELNDPSLLKGKTGSGLPNPGTNPYSRVEHTPPAANRLDHHQKASFIEHPEILGLIKAEIDRLHNKKGGTRPWERIVHFRILPEEWTLEHGLMTFTLKKKRNAIAEKYEDYIREMFR